MRHKMPSSPTNSTKAAATSEKRPDNLSKILRSARVTATTSSGNAAFRVNILMVGTSGRNMVNQLYGTDFHKRSPPSGDKPVVFRYQIQSRAKPFS